MQKINFWNIIRILRYQIIIGIAVLWSLPATAQFGNTSKLRQYRDRSYYFGITLGYNQAYLKMDYDPKFLESDSILRIDPLHSSGFSIGLLGNLKIIQHLDLRFNPILHFSEKNLKYGFGGALSADKDEIKKIESVVMSLPLQVKFKSNRVGNFRAYILAGIKYDYDFASNSNARNVRDIVKLAKTDWGYEAGVGFEFYLPYFIFSPEIKFSYGARDVHIYEPQNKYSNRIGQLISRLIVISIHLEG